MALHTTPPTLTAPGSAALLGRRALPRVAMSFPLRLHLAGFSTPLDARARDLGAGGVCAATPTCFAMGDVRRITLLLASGPADLDAEGRWQLEVSGEDGFFTGIRFTAAPDERVDQLWDLVHERSKSLARWLCQQPDFAALSLRDAVDLAQLTRLREIRSGGVLYRQGVRDDSIFVVTRGEVVLERRTSRQRRLTVGRAGPGQTLGGLAVVANTLPTEAAVADRDVSLLEISRGAFENLQRASPGLAFQVASLVIQGHLERVDTALGRLVDGDR